MRRRIRFATVVVSASVAAILLVNSGSRGKLAAFILLGVVLLGEDLIEHGRLPRRRGPNAAARPRGRR